MGNIARKNGQGPTGSHLDLFHTPPTSPSDSELATMASAPVSAQGKRQTPSPGAAGNAPAIAAAIADWSHTLSVPPEWALVGLESSGSPEGTGSEGSTSSPPACPGERPPSRGCPSEHSWQERDSGLETQAGTETPLALLGLLEHHSASLGLNPGQDTAAGAVQLLRHLLVEREDLVEEVRSLKDTLRAERLEWHQFQSDLQVAVSVADRLRVEAEEALGKLRERYWDLEGQLSQALRREQERDGELETLRAEHRDARLQLSALTRDRQHNRAELDRLSDTLETDKETEDADRGAERSDAEERETEKDSREEETPAMKEREDTDKQTGEKTANGCADVRAEGPVPVESLNTGESQLTGKGVAEAYLRSLAAVEKRREQGCCLKDPRRIVMLSERSRSLSRIPLPTDPSSTQNGTSQNPSNTTLPLCKKEEPAKERRTDRILLRQDSWSSFNTKKQEEDQNSDSFRPQDGFSLLLRRHGGSRRNSLLRWCQSRTQGYKNIEITNFSSSWEDGLAFCAVYHTYLPTHVPYNSLTPVDKKENLGLAFQTGESVGITATLTEEEMLRAGGPDWQRVLGYVESMYRHFEM